MLKKTPLLFPSILLSFILTAQQGSVRIEKAALLFYDSTEIAPVVNLIPYDQSRATVHYLEYENVGTRDIFNITEEYIVTHLNSPRNPGIGLVYVSSVNFDTLLVSEQRKVKVQNCTFDPPVLGNFRMDFLIKDSSNLLLDSASFFFEVADTIVSKSNYRSATSSTGPSFFQDSNLNQNGGFMVGDRFGTLMENNGNASSVRGVPTSVSFYITADTSNVGVEIVPKIWTATLDSTQTSLRVGNEVASSFIPIMIDSSRLGSLLTIPLDNGTAVFSGLNGGKYIVGFESTLPNPNGKSLILGRDTIGEMVQPPNSSFVYFGHDTNWYAVNDLPMINLNFGNRASFMPTRPCIPVGLNDEPQTQLELAIHPNPSSGIFNVETFEVNQNYQVYNVNGRLVEVSIINGQLDLSNKPNGIYLLRIQLANGEVHSKKLMKN